MRVLAVHPGPLMYTKIYLRLEPLGLELVAEAARRAGHDVRLLDLQVEGERDYLRMIHEWVPDAVLFSCNYLANVPEIVDLAKLTKSRQPGTFIIVGGHSASFVAMELLDHGQGAIDCVLKGEGEANIAALLAAAAQDRQAVPLVPGAVTPAGEGNRSPRISCHGPLMRIVRWSPAITLVDGSGAPKEIARSRIASATRRWNRCRTGER